MTTPLGLRVHQVEAEAGDHDGRQDEDRSEDRTLPAVRLIDRRLTIVRRPELGTLESEEAPDDEHRDHDRETTAVIHVHGSSFWTVRASHC